MSAVFETKPRWPAAPPICIKANLPAFESKEAYLHFHERNSGSCSIKRIWKCDWCGWFHGEIVPPSPSGDSSGTGRSTK